jgi:hypothetical protein
LLSVLQCDAIAYLNSSGPTVHVGRRGGSVKGIDDGLLVHPVTIELPSRGVNPRRNDERKG